jgi:hypothetical protein
MDGYVWSVVDDAPVATGTPVQGRRLMVVRP